MLRKMFGWSLGLVMVAAWPLLADEKTPPWTQLSLSTCGVDKFHKENPEVDGRGVVIAVLDTGVDMGVPGLTVTPDGQPKVIDVQDFTGEGDVALSEISYDVQRDKLVRNDNENNPVEYGFTPANKQPAGTRFWFGLLPESRFANSEVTDPNNNGQTSDDYAILVMVPPGAADDQAVVYVDTNCNRDWSDEKALLNYHVKQDTFQFAREKKESQFALLTCAVNVFLSDKKVILHFDDGGHGTHVAGIAAGYRINNQPNFHGVAPGAKVISLKIGNNTYSGGATVTASKKKAFEYAAEYARKHNVPVVCNLSYGIGSERDGHSDIDTFLDKLLRENPNLVVFTSAGNEGPGLSSVGTPAAAPAAITIAALLAADSARDVMSVQMEGPQLALFSSRGGELAKPDIAVPGYATSTVPRWNRRGDFWRGTSMASPYACGMGAVMVSAAVKQYPDHAQRSSWVRQALARSARPLAGFQALDYGAGVPEMSTAVEVYLQMVASLQDDILFDYDVTTPSPLAVGGQGPTAYWRTPYFPNDRSQVFTVQPRFTPTSDAEQVANFSRQYTLKSDADWCQVRQQQVYFRGEQSATVNVDYDSSKLKQPGLYVATITGDAEGQVGFRLINTVVVPYTFDITNQYQTAIANQKVEGWKVQRYFFAVPAGASAMHLQLGAVENQPAELAIREIFKPNGDTLGNGQFRLDTKNQLLEAQWTISGDDLQTGVWELCTYSRKPDETANYQLQVRFSGITAQPAAITNWRHPEGQKPSGQLILTQLWPTAVPISASGTIDGYRATLEQKLTPAEDTLNRSITFQPEIKAVRVDIEYSEDDFARFTDVPVCVYDANGTAIAKDGMSYRQLSLLVNNPNPTGANVSCNLEVRPAFALTDPEIFVNTTVKLTYLYRDPIQVSISGADMLYPGVATRLNFKLSATPPQNPTDTVTVGSIHLTHPHTQQELLTLPIEK
ncbi:MAG: hypothetical protein HJJLKODD_00778 [Phycisphaerae bacterium]|nr:hypothetical protein [Phycisphaerae bacterium]